jgi:uncharacterized membrane protein YfcA
VPPAAWLTIGAVALGAALAGFVEGAAELEFPLVAMSLWAWILPPQLAAPLAVFGALLGQVASLFPLRGGFDLKRVAPFVVGGALGVPLGVFLLHNSDPARFRLAVGALLTLFGLYALAGRDSARVKAGGIGADAFVGVVGGVLGGLSGLAAAPAAMWTRLRGWKREPRRATVKTFAIVVAVLTLAAYARTGAVDPADLRLFALVAPVALVASFLGARLVGKGGAQAVGRVALLLTLVSGAALLVAAGRGLWGR